MTAALPQPLPAQPPPARGPWSIERKLTLGFGLAAALIVGIAALCFWQATRFLSENRSVEHTHRVIDELENVLGDVKDIETSQRAFTLFGIETLLREYHDGLDALPVHLYAVRGLEVAGNGRLALAALGREPDFALVLMDCQMPEMDGYEATRRQCEREAAAGDGRRIAIVAMTANAMGGDREKCLEAGMDDYLSKPVKQDGPEAVLRRWLPLPAAAAAPEKRPRDRESASRAAGGVP